MENELCKKKTTAPDTSVGADDGQPLHNLTENSISAFEEKSTVISKQHGKSGQNLPQDAAVDRPVPAHDLHELYQTAYQSRPPIIDGLLYAGAYISQVR